MSESTKAVFLSYASQDVAAALRICATLRAAGVEVWFDQDALVGGDAWDGKIRGQIKECALFLPVISANTQARKEGYFRIEWDLAAERAQGIAHGVPFIIPILIDDTNEPGALVPDRFRKVQWTKLPGGETSTAFVARAQKLLGVSRSEPTMVARPLDEAQGGLIPAAPSGAPVSSDVAVQNLELPGVVRRPFEGASETLVPLRGLWRRALPLVFALGVGVFLTVAVAWRLWPHRRSGDAVHISASRRTGVREHLP